MKRSRPPRPSRRSVFSAAAVAALLVLLVALSTPLVEAQQVQQQQQQQQGRQQQQQQQEERQAATKKAEQDRAEAEARRAQRRAEAEMERQQREEERAVREGDQQQQQNVGTVELRASNFDASVRDGSAWLVEFYAPWCGHCKRFAPTYEKVAETLHAQSKADLAKDPAARTVKVAKVDGSADRALASRFNIRGYPTFFLVDGWDVYEYEGDRTLEDLVDFVTEDYVDYEPLPFLNSPFGPMGQLRAFFILAGSAAVSSFNWMVKEKGFSEVVAAMIMMGVAISIGLFLIIFIGLLSVAKPKTD